MRWWLSLVVLGVVVSAAPAAAKKIRYASGPAPSVDTVFSVAEAELEPIVRARGPRVPLTNLQVVGRVANLALQKALASAPLDSGGHVLLAPAESHPLNFVVEHAILRELGKRGVTAMVRRSIIPDDSLAAIAGNPGDPVLEYQLASARVTYIRLRGWIWGRVKIERQALVEGAVTLRDPGTSVVLWSGDAAQNLVDAFPRGQLSLVEDSRYAELTGTVPTRSVGKALEPAVVVAIVGGLIALFFQNRP